MLHLPVLSDVGMTPPAPSPSLALLHGSSVLTAEGRLGPDCALHLLTPARARSPSEIAPSAAHGQVPHSQQLFGGLVAFSVQQTQRPPHPLHNLILAPKINPTAPNSAIPRPPDRPEYPEPAKMLSRTVRAVSCRALAAPLRPIAAPISRQLAPQVSQPQRRNYHEKVLDRTSAAAAVADSTPIGIHFTNDWLINTFFPRQTTRARATSAH